MPDSSDTEILATVQASAGRRFLGIGLLMVLGALVIYVAFAAPPSLGWQVFLVALGVTALMVADAMRRSTAHVLELTRMELRESSGTVIAQVADIAGIDRGAFAFKPSNGFLLRLSRPVPRQWRPGLWWRVGRRVGVGGMTPGRQTKFMAEIIAVMLAEREQGDSAP
ncbi:hypothetical protein So717_37970 [Roseobacter cerasinus]|uniref:Uncharacterized protein n=1 Tax=Roseobacter cerasinus TaxID=2602289 RepID=A0A640VWR1_9RHOB|nr:hypothetical protein [Roseobacter cerasinus]GFE52044.1 hypothetical protein So717_37970 [Roseobacter cerasinus]